MNFAMTTLGLKEMGKFSWEGREKSLHCEILKTKVAQHEAISVPLLVKIHV